MRVVQRGLRFVILLLLLMMVVLITGCGGGGSGTTTNFKQGIGELQFRMLPNAPPDKIYQGSGFKIIVEASNHAAYDLKGVEVSIVGLNEKYFALTNKEHIVPLMTGKSLLTPIGDVQFLEFSGSSNMLFENANEYIGNYFLKAKYHSTMEFGDTVCIHPSLYDVTDAGCKVQDHKSYGGQGAPLAVTDIEEIIYPSGAGGEVEFRIHIANRGSGIVKGVVLGKANLGSEELECEFKGKDVTAAEGTVYTQKSVVLKEDNQEALLICKMFLKDQSSYTTTLGIDFGYEYEWKQQYSLRLVR